MASYSILSIVERYYMTSARCASLHVPMTRISLPSPLTSTILLHCLPMSALGNSTRLQDLAAAEKEIACLELQITTADSQLALLFTQNHRNETNTEHDEEIYNELWDHECNPNWERATHVCYRFYAVATCTPELWTHVELSWPPGRIERYLLLSGTCALTSVIGVSESQSLDSEDDEEVQLHLAALAYACLRRSHTSNMSLKHMSELELKATVQTEDRLPLPLSMLHINQWDTILPSSEAVGLLHDSCLALAELSIWQDTVADRFNYRLPLLTRLHLDSLLTVLSCIQITSFLRHTPQLTDLSFDSLKHYGYVPGTITPALYDLALPHLRRLATRNSTVDIICNFLGALSLNNHALQDLIIENQVIRNNPGVI
jgi:hypothetical protein